MSAPEPTLEWLLSASASETGIDRKALAGLLLEAARSIDQAKAAAVSGVKAADPRLDELRTLLVGREIEHLARLGKQVEDPEQFADLVSRALPSAFAQASSRDERLGQVLAPSMEKATQTSIQSNPRTLVNIIYPVIVPAIRKSIAETIDDTFQALNETLKYSLTWRGLKWRLEAWRTGQSFTAVVLKHTLVFQVEHVFLIHRHTGLLISHVTGEHAESQDPQLVSSMLVAIQDFIRDSFSGAEGGGLDTLRLGELLLWSEQGQYASLVAVIRGNPPEALHNTLREVLTKIHEERQVALEKFEGDSAPFADVEAQLAEIVQLRQEAEHHKKAEFPWLLVPIIVALLVGGVWLFEQWRRDSNRWEIFVTRLAAQPGIAITGTDRHDGKWHINGLRDPLAIDPNQLLRESGLSPENVVANWQPYQALNPPLLLKRLQNSLDPPPTVTLGVQGNDIVATGSASYAWLQKARKIVSLLPLGSPHINLAGVRDLNDGVFGKLRDSIQSREVRFDYNEAAPAQGQEATIDALAEDLRKLAELSAQLRVSTRVTVTGHSDSTGKGAVNMSLSLARAEVVRALLKKRGVDPDLLSVRGAGPLEPLKDEASDTERSINRRVSLNVAIEE